MNWMDDHSAAKYLGVSRRVLQRWCRQRRIKFGRAGRKYRFTPEILDRFQIVSGGR